jgi:hypothetical protein
VICSIKQKRLKDALDRIAAQPELMAQLAEYYRAKEAKKSMTVLLGESLCGPHLTPEIMPRDEVGILTREGDKRR